MSPQQHQQLIDDYLYFVMTEPSTNESSMTDVSKPTGNPVTIYTDGACKGNPGAGGWGALLCYGERRKELHGGEAQTTNNRMELTAAIRALEALKKPCNIILYTDSVYVKDGINTWITNWKKRNWRTSANKPVKNDDLWKALDAARSPHEIDWRWVKGHAGDPGNERADELANLGVQSLR